MVHSSHFGHCQIDNKNEIKSNDELLLMSGAMFRFIHCWIHIMLLRLSGI